MKTCYRWCRCCGRVYPSEKARYFKGIRILCRYRGCNGTIFNSETWAHMRESHPDYPECPELGVNYIE